MAEPAANASNLQELNEQIYKHSLELAVVNKNLSLLKKLYQISLLSLDPASISEKISETVRVDLNMEIVGIFLYTEKDDVLQPYKFSHSDRLAKTLTEQKLKLEDLDIAHPIQNVTLKKVLAEKESTITSNLKDIWVDSSYSEKLEVVSDASHIQTILLYPLVTQDEVIGMLMMGLNRGYDALSEFEQEAIRSLTNVVAVAVDKALLYVELQDANEQLKALDKARAEFISIASHQLRTPPATIKWYVGAILGGDFGPLSDDLKAALERTMVTNDSQIATIDDLLNASRIERGKLEFFFEEAPLEPVISTLVEQMKPLAGMKKMTVEYQKPSGELPPIMMDREKIRQVLNNMIDNAIKYSPGGAIKVALKKTDTDYIVSVTDNGKGIAPKDMEAVFAKYSRGNDSVTHAQGLGLGMYVAKVIMDQHHGKIWAESPGVGKGSTFFFSLPLKNTLVATTVDLAKQMPK